MLKVAKYRNRGWPLAGPEFNTVVYVITRNVCCFSGIERENRTSTINAVRNIVRAIAGQEGRPITGVRFFDLQTHRGYDKRPGEFAFDEVVLKPEYDQEHPKNIPGFYQTSPQAMAVEEFGNSLNVIRWEPIACPAGVLQLFREYVCEGGVGSIQ